MSTDSLFTPNAPDFLKNPYPAYEALRKVEPVYYTQQGYWVLTCYQDIVDAIKSGKLSNAPSPYAVINKRNKDKYVAADVANNIFAFMDPPLHGETRKLVSRLFQARRRQQLPILPLAEQLLDKYRQQGEIDIINDFGRPLSFTVMSRIIGFSLEDEQQLKKWSNMFFYLFTPIGSAETLEALNQGLTEFRSYLADLIRQRAASPQDDLISDFVQEAHSLSDIELIDTLLLLISDGIENVDSCIGNSIITLINNPDQLDKLRQEPDLLESAVEECLRYNTPAHLVAKVALEDIELHGKLIKKGSAVVVVVASANHDQNQFENADIFDISRGKIEHLTFGKGRHTCLGAPLVRQEMAAALEAISKNLHDLKLVKNEQQWIERFGHQWLEKLTVVFRPY